MPRFVHARMMVSVHGAVVAAIAAVALVGHFIDIPMMATWSGVVPMAVPTALCFLLCGSSLVAIGLEPKLWHSHGPES